MPTINSDWTEPRLAHLKRLFDEGYSGAVMASELGVSRNAALATCNRKGWKRPTSHTAIIDNMHKIRRATKQNLKQSRQQSYGGRAANLQRNAGNREIREAAFEHRIDPLDLDIPKRQRKTFWQLTPYTCHYPVGDPREKSFFFCGAKALFWEYCARHKAICWTKPRRA